MEWTRELPIDQSGNYNLTYHQYFVRKSRGPPLQGHFALPVQLAVGYILAHEGYKSKRHIMQTGLDIKIEHLFTKGINSDYLKY